VYHLSLSNLNLEYTESYPYSYNSAPLNLDEPNLKITFGAYQQPWGNHHHAIAIPRAYRKRQISHPDTEKHPSSMKQL
jgi:hypothetical protein